MQADLDEHLGSGREYFYRFSYDGTHSPVGRCQTVPAPEDSPDATRDRLVVLRVPEGEVRIEEIGSVDPTVDMEDPR